LLVGDVDAARVHARASARLSKVARMEKVARSTEAVLGLIAVLSGAVKRGLSVVDRELTFARDANHTELPDYLSICIDAYEAAGYSDRALEYLYELVAWKKKSVETAVLPLQYEGLTNSIQFQTGISLFDNGLFAKAYSLESGVRDRIQRLVETAINAEIGGGHDIYRPFRVANLARYLAASLGWNHQRIASLVLGAQLCNIGMIAIPARILVKPDRLSEGENNVLHSHTEYGADLLRRSKLQVLDIAAVIAEQHHEHYDGSGYPHGLSGEAIAEEARIVAVCDAFDAMTHKRPSRQTPLSIDAALRELMQGAGRQFDPPLVNAFVEFIQRESSRQDDFDAFLSEGADEIEYVRVRARMEALIDEGDALRGQAA
jgi:HD-GYP domain-containing protein (c-di-GMP phosphodiesterase class II)